MTIHNAAMTKLSQWWQRQVRTGYAGYDVERRFGLGIFDRIIKSSLCWGLAWPVLALFATAFFAWRMSSAWAIGCLAVALLGWLLQTGRIAWRTKSANYNWTHSWQFALFTMAAKVPIACGVIRQLIGTALGKQTRLVEYKTAENFRPQA